MKMTKRSALILAVPAAAVLSFAGLGVAAASIPDSSGVIHGCYKTPVPAHGTPLSVVDTDAGGSCPGGTAPLTWNQAGPPGPAGATGATGATGPVGPSTGGSTGLDLQIIEASGNGSATATCPSDHPYLFGGGGYDSSQSVQAGGFSGVENYPDSKPQASESETGTGPHSWTAVAPDNLNEGMVAYAICGK